VVSVAPWRSDTVRAVAASVGVRPVAAGSGGLSLDIPLSVRTLFVHHDRQRWGEGRYGPGGKGAGRYVQAFGYDDCVFVRDEHWAAASAGSSFVGPGSGGHPAVAGAHAGADASFIGPVRREPPSRPNANFAELRSLAQAAASAAATACDSTLLCVVRAQSSCTSAPSCVEAQIAHAGTVRANKDAESVAKAFDRVAEFLGVRGGGVDTEVPCRQ
jgi:hypothetical protein